MEEREVEELVTPSNILKLVDTLLDSGLAFDELCRQNNTLLPMIEKMLKANQSLSDKELKQEMLKFVLTRHRQRIKEKECVLRVIEGYLQGIVVVVNQNDETAKVLYEESKRKEINEALQTIQQPNFDKQKAMTLTEQEALCISEKNKFSISLYNALNNLLDGTSITELRGKGVLGELLADTMEKMKESKNLHLRMQMLRILVQAIPQQTTNNTLQFIQQASTQQTATKEEEKNKSIVDFLDKLKKAKTIS